MSQISFKNLEFCYILSSRFWYISLVSCSRPRPHKAKECSWSYNTSLDLQLKYDIWLVNGDPNTKHMNPFEHQFSYEMHDVLEIYLTFLVLNAFLLVIQVWVFRAQRHALIFMLTAMITIEVCLWFTHCKNSEYTSCWQSPYRLFHGKEMHLFLHELIHQRLGLHGTSTIDNFLKSNNISVASIKHTVKFMTKPETF